MIATATSQRPPELPPIGCGCTPPTYRPSALWPGPARSTTIERDGDDDFQTATTVQTMAVLARQDSMAPAILRIAKRLQLDSEPATTKARAVFHWVKSHVTFVTDQTLATGTLDRPDEQEVLVRPVDLLAMPQPRGDCDDFSMLTAALLLALDVPCYFKTVAAGRDSNAFSHVYVVALVDGHLMPLDCSHGPYAGWEVATRGKSRLWPIALSMRSNLGDIVIGPDQDGGEASPPYQQGPNWWDLAKIGTNTAADIFKARYAVPPAGTYITQGRNGSTLYRQPAGAGQFAFPGASLDLGGGNTTLLLIGGAAVVLFLLARGRH